MGQEGKAILNDAVRPAAAGVTSIATILTTLAGPLVAQEWTAFGIRDAGFTFDVPPDFSLDQRAEDGQAATFKGPDEAIRKHSAKAARPS